MKVNNSLNKNYQSTGNLFMDHLIGGISIGTIVLMIEDTPTKIHESFLKYFMAEGIVKEQKVYLYSSNSNTRQNLTNLPYKSTQVDTILNSKRANETKQGEIKIAWRYENINYSNAIEDIVKSTDYIFDLSRTLQDNYTSINNYTLTILEAKDGIDFLKQIIDNISNDYTKYTSNLKEEEIKYSRFIIPNLFENVSFKDNSKTILDLKVYLNVLKNLARSINGIIYITVSKEYLMKNIFNLIYYYSDYVFSLQSFLMNNQKLEEYDALFTIKKLPKICILKSHVDLDTDTYGVIVEKKKIVIEKVDIGPEIDRNTKVKEKDVKDMPTSQAICGQEKYSKNFEF